MADATITEIKGTGDIRLSLRGDPVSEVRRFRFNANDQGSTYPTATEAWQSNLWDTVPDRVGGDTSSVRKGEQNPNDPSQIVQDIDSFYVDRSKFVFEFLIIYGFRSGAGGSFPSNLTRRRWSVGVATIEVQTGLELHDFGDPIGNKPELVGEQHYDQVFDKDGQLVWDPAILRDPIIEHPIVDPDAVMVRPILVPEITSDAFMPAGAVGFGALPVAANGWGIGDFISRITDVHGGSTGFQGAGAGQAQYMGFAVEEVGQQGQFNWTHHFRYGENRVTDSSGETLRIPIDRDWYWTWTLHEEKGNRIPHRLIQYTKYLRSNLNLILGT